MCHVCVSFLFMPDENNFPGKTNGPGYIIIGTNKVVLSIYNLINA